MAERGEGETGGPAAFEGAKDRQLSALSAENDALKTQVQQLRGEATPVHSHSEETADQRYAKPLAARVGDRRAQLAASVAAMHAK